MRLILFCLISIFWLSPSDRANAACVQDGLVCVSYGDHTVNGVTYSDVCLERIASYVCDNPNAHNYCEVLDTQTGACTFQGETCVTEQHGSCVEYQRTYECFNGDIEYEHAVLVDRVAENFLEEISGDCDALRDNPDCGNTDTICTEPSEIRTVNGFEFARDCWAWEREFHCLLDGTTNTCQDYETNPECRQIADDCINEENGVCTHWDVTYQCGGQGDEEPLCEGQSVCVGNLCMTYDSEPSDDFLVAQAWLRFLAEASEDRSANNETIFNGRFLFCRRQGFGFKDCCSGDGWGIGLGISACRDEEVELKAARESYRTVYIGTWCNKKIFGFCLSRRRGYCVFNSRFGRVAQEQVRGQLGRGFGGIGTHDCNGLTIETLESVDLTELDFREAFPDLERNVVNTDSDVFERRVIDRLDLQ